VPPTTPAFTPLTDPMVDYGRSTGVTVTGGYVYRGRALGPNYYGRYFLADSGSGHVWSVAWGFDAGGRANASNPIDHSPELGATFPTVSFIEDTSGELYLVVISGSLLKLVSSNPAPTGPSNLTSQVSGRTVTLSWTGVSGATQYRIAAGSQAGAANLAVIDTGSPQTSFVATGVGDGVYYVRVRALAGATASAESNEVVVTVNGGAACTTAPPPPAGLSATVSGRLVSLNWSASGTITSISLEAGFSAGASNAAMIVLDPSARTFSTNAPPGTYYVRVRATNACGTSTPSNEILVSVP
jgi:hypothetical protein